MNNKLLRRIYYQARIDAEGMPCNLSTYKYWYESANVAIDSIMGREITVRELAELIAATGPVDVTFIKSKSGIIECSNEAGDGLEVGMKGSIIKVEEMMEDGEYGGHEIYLDLSKFYEHNKKLMIPVYYDKNGNPTLTWIEYGSYPKNHKLSFWVDGGSKVKLL